MFCPNCGKEVSREDRFCPNCGTNLDNIPVVEQEVQTLKTNSIDIDNKELYATAFSRLGAYLLDIIVFYIALIIFFLILSFIGVVDERTFVVNEDAINLLGLILGWLYFALQESSMKQATIGQRALKIKVVDYNFERISFARATGRHFAMFISILILFIGIIMIFFTKRRQALHDIIAGTLVIKGQ